MDVLKWYMKCNTLNKHVRSSFSGIMKLAVKAMIFVLKTDQT